MSPTGTRHGAVTLVLSEEERSLLLRFLEQGLRDKQLEEHRTEAFDFKQHVQHQEALLQGLIDQLRRS